MDKWEIEKLIDKKIEESKPKPPGCLDIIASIILTILGLNFIVLPLILTSVGVYKGLIDKGLSVWQALNYSIGWSTQLVPIIVDSVMKTINR